MKKIVSLFCVVLLLSACSKSSDPNPVVNPPQKNVYFFSVTDNSGNAPVTNIAAFTEGDTAATSITSAGTNFSRTFFNSGNGVMYGENGMFYKATADNFGTITTQQLSFATDNTKICESGIKDTYGYVFFKKPGSDGFCGTINDLGPFVVYSGMSQNDALYKPSVYPLASIELKSGIGGWLMFANNTLSKANSDFSKSTLIATDFTSVKLIHKTANHIVLDVDGQIRIYDNAKGVLSGNLHLVLNGGVQNGITNDTTFFFNDGTAIYRLPLDGSLESAVFFSEVVGEIITIRAIVGDLLIYTTIGAKTQHNRTVNESIHTLNVNINLAANVIIGNTLVTRDAISTVAYTKVYGSRVYFNRLGGAGEASMILTDGTGLEVIPNSLWIGETLTSIDGTTIPNQKIFLVTSLLDQANFNLISYDAANYKVSSLLKTLPNVNKIGSLHLDGSAGLGVLIDDAGTSTDIFYIDTATQDSFFRVPGADNLTESLIQ